MSTLDFCILIFELRAKMTIAARVDRVNYRTELVVRSFDGIFWCWLKVILLSRRKGVMSFSSVNLHFSTSENPCPLLAVKL